VRYKKLKAIYFGSQDQLKQLQNELEKQPWGRDELRNMPGLYDRRPGNSTHGQLPEHEFTEAERIRKLVNVQLDPVANDFDP
jgi:hypothetical protein